MKSPEGVEMVWPLGLGLKRDGSDLWTLPWEPLVSVRGRNVVVRSVVAKRRERGTVKQLWTTDDYAVSIEGRFQATTEDELLGQIERLRKLCEAPQSLYVQCPALEPYGITLLAVEDWELPFTAGEWNQDYRLLAFSDNDFDLLIKPR